MRSMITNAMILNANACSVLRFSPTSSLQNGTDAWGITWKDGQAVTHPMEHLSDAEILSYPFPPLPTDAQCIAFLHEARHASHGGKKNVILEVGSTFYPACDLLARDEFFVRCITEPRLMEQLLNRLARYHAEVWCRVLSYARDDIFAIRFTENFGTAGHANLRPEVYRRLVKPAQSILVAQIKRMYPDLPVCYRCTASAYTLIPDFATIRFDAWEPLAATPYEHNEILQFQHMLGDSLTLICDIQPQSTLSYHPSRMQYAT